MWTFILTTLFSLGFLAGRRSLNNELQMIGQRGFSLKSYDKVEFSPSSFRRTKGEGVECARKFPVEQLLTQLQKAKRLSDATGESGTVAVFTCWVDQPQSSSN